MGQNVICRADRREQVAEHGVGQACVVEELLHRQRRGRHVLRVLQDDRVPREDLRCRDADDLVIREVPRLDRVDDPERLVHDRDRALARVLDSERLVLEESRAAVGEIVEDFGAEFHLGFRLGDNLAHFLRQYFRKGPLVRAKQFSGPRQDLRPVAGSGGAPPEEGHVGLFDGGIDLLIGRERVTLDQLAVYGFTV